MIPLHREDWFTRQINNLTPQLECRKWRGGFNHEHRPGKKERKFLGSVRSRGEEELGSSANARKLAASDMMIFLAKVGNVLRGRMFIFYHPPPPTNHSLPSYLKGEMKMGEGRMLSPLLNNNLKLFIWNSMSSVYLPPPSVWSGFNMGKVNILPV